MNDKDLFRVSTEINALDKAKTRYEAECQVLGERVKTLKEIIAKDEQMGLKLKAELKDISSKLESAKTKHDEITFIMEEEQSSFNEIRGKEELKLKELDKNLNDLRQQLNLKAS